MKIRTGFVTNSSGSSHTRVVVDNKELCEIIKKYQNKINDKINSMYTMGKITTTFINDNYISDSGYWEYGKNKDTFWTFNEDISDIPIKYVKKLKNEFKNILKDKVINDIFDELHYELLEKAELIKESYKKIQYEYSYSGDLGGCEIENKSITYDITKKCPKCNSALISKRREGEKMDENSNWKGYLEENIYCSNKNCDYIEKACEENKHNFESNDGSQNVITDKEIDSTISDDDLPF